MILVERIEKQQLDNSVFTTELITTIEDSDIPEPDAGRRHKRKAIGFCVAYSQD